MGGRSPLVAILLISLAAAVVSLELIGISHGSTTTFCRGLEGKALMEFKNGLHDPSNRLRSWVGDDCCAWEGVGCSNVTGHVVKVDLRNKRRLYLTDDCDDDYLYQWSPDAIGCKSALHGDITPSLLSLVHLKSLDLSGNYLDHNRVPKFLGSFSRLTYLRLSGAGFLGRIPDELGNISTLHRLDLSYNYHQNGYGLSSQQTLYLENPGWLSRLTSLRHLNMNWVSFRNAPNWLQALNALPHIQEIELINCHLGTFPPSLPHVNFTSLTTLDLSYNFINSSIPDWLFNITSLEYLYLSWNELNWLSPASIARFTSLRALDLSGNAFPNGFISAALSNLCNLQILILRGVPINDVLANLEVVFSGCLMFSLEELDLCDAQLSGSLPDWLGNLKNLKHLDLSSNFLYGSVPASLGSLSLLQHLDVNSNNLNGTIAEGIGQMKGLVLLHLGNNSLSLSEVHLANLSSLKSLDISHNSLVLKESNDWIPPFQLQTLCMAFCQIGPKPHFPKWLRTQRTLYDLDLTHAGIQGMIPKWLPSSLEDLVLSNNMITGHVPQYLSNLTYLNLRNNSFSGHLPPRITIAMPNIYMLDLSMNNLSGSIPLSFCQIKFWEILLLFKNNLSGKLPDCWKDSSHLAFLDLSSNRLEGGIPNSTCNLQSLQSLHLSHNYLSGQISLSLKGCTKLVTLDLSHNNFTGKIPTWIGENLLHIKVLDLRSNVFTGSIPEFSLLSSLQILDLSNNNLSGTIPRSFGNFSAMKRPLQVL